MKTLLNFAKKAVLPCLAVVGVAYAIYYSMWAQNLVPAETLNPVSSAQPPRELGTVLAGAAIVESAGGEVEVATPMAGVLESVIGQEDVGKLIPKGKELLRLDSKEKQAELEVRQAQLAHAQADLKRMENMPRQEDLTPLEFQWRELQIAVQSKKGDYDRALKAGNAITAQELQEYNFAHETAKAQLKTAEAKWRQVKAGAWEPEKAVARAAIKLAESQVAQVQSELDRLIVHCQSDLTLLRVDVRPQEYVGIPPDRTIILLGDTKNLHLRVYLDEHDASRFVPGAKARARLPQGQEYLEFPLVYVRHEPVIVPKPTLTGEQTERVDVRVLPLIYRFEKDDDQRRVFVGQQLDVYINEK